MGSRSIGSREVRKREGEQPGEQSPPELSLREPGSRALSERRGTEPRKEQSRAGGGEVDLTVKPDRGLAVAEVAPSPLLDELPIF